MENTGTETITSQDLQKLIHIYIKALGISYKTPFEDIIILLNDKFALVVTKDDLLTYFEPTLEEFTTDLVFQMNNIN